MNFNLYYAYKLFKDTIPIYPVYLLMFESRGMSLTQVSYLLAIWSLAVILFEVPTGILADHWSRKGMLIIGGMCKASCYVLWFLSQGFAMFAFGFVLWGISEAFCSGSEEALLYDTLKLEGKEKLFDRIYGKGNFYSSIGVALSCLVGGFLSFLITYKGVLLLSVLFTLLSVFLVANFREVNCFKLISRSEPENNTNPLSTLLDAVSLCFKNRQLLMIILMMVMVIGTASILDEYDQIIARSYDLTLGSIGVWICIRYLLEAFGSRFAYRIRVVMNKLGARDTFYTVSIVCVCASCLLLLFGITSNILLIPMYGLFYMLMASAGVIFEEFVQQKINEQGRSTVHSLISLFSNLYAVGFFSIVALTISRSSIKIGIISVAIYIIILSLFLCLMYRISYEKQRMY